MSQKPVQYRQGDIFFELVDVPVPADAKPADKVVAHGEVTGHAHVLEGVYSHRVSIDPVDGEVHWIDTDGCEVRHDEHNPIPLGAGRWRATRQRCIDPASLAEQVVAD